MSTLILWVLIAGLILLARGSEVERPSHLKRTEKSDFWLWEHERTREVSHE